MKYTIFSIDGEDAFWNRHIFENLFLTSRHTLGKCIPLVGMYKGEHENSYICLSYDFNSFVLPMGFVTGQESILRVSECNKKYTDLIMLQGGKQVHLGCMKSVTEEQAMREESWSYRPDLNQYFITVKGNNNHYPDITEGVSAEEIAAFHGERCRARTEANGQGRYV